MWASYKPKADAHARRYQHSDPGAARSGINPTHTSLPFFGYGNRSGDGRTNGYFSSEWSGNPQNPSQRDYWLYLADRAFTEGGLRTTYWDIFFADLVGNVLSGQAYILPDGRTQRGYAGWNARRFFMRLYALMGDHGLAPGGMMTHASNNYLLIAGGWVDAILDGEFHDVTADSEHDWVDGYPIDRMRFKSTPHNWGIAMSWMDHIGGPGRKNFPGAGLIRRGLQDYVRMFDTWRGPNNGTMPASVLAFGANGEDVEYTPFWQTGNLAKTHNKDVLVSLWRMPNRVMVGVFNYNREQEITTRIDLNLKALGLENTLVNCTRLAGEDNHEFQSNGQLTVNKLMPHTGRFYGVRGVEAEALDVFHEQYLKLARNAFRHTLGADCLNIPDSVLTHNVVTPQTKFFPPGQTDTVSTDDTAEKVYSWQLPDRLLIGVLNSGQERKNITLNVDFKALGLMPELLWQEFIRFHTLIGPANFNLQNRTVTLPSVAPGTGRLILLRRY